MITLLSSTSIPVSTVAPAWHLARQLRDSGVRTISGFHTPLERECLELLLRGTQPITIVPARAYELGQWLYGGQLWTDIKVGLSRGNISIISPPGMIGNRVTKENAKIRNQYLLQLGQPLLVLAAPPESKTAAMAHEALKIGLPVFVLPHKTHQALFDAGAIEATIDAIQNADV